MSQAQPHPADRLPGWLIAVGSLAILYHLTAVVLNVLAARSGPWVTTQGGPADPPAFALAAANSLAVDYLRAVKLTHNYHFATNRLGYDPGVRFEARLKDEAGRELATVQFPDPDANAAVRYRQALLAQGLGDDYPVLPPPTEVIPAPGQPVREVLVWDEAEGRKLRLRRMPEHLLPRDQPFPMLSPNDLALLLARSYARYLCRTHGAASAEIVRRHQRYIPPAVLLPDNDVPPGALDVMASYFGELPR